MEVNIDINDYLSKEKIVEIAREELSSCFRDLFRTEKDVERILVNLSYEYIFKLIDSVWNKNFEELLKDRVKKCLKEKDLGFYIFRRKDDWNNIESPAIKIIDEEIEKSKPLIKEMVEEHIKKYPSNELDKNEIAETIQEVILDKILCKDEDK